MMKAGVSLRKYRCIKNALSTGALPAPLSRRGKKSSEAAVSNFKAFPLKLPSPGSRAHPCLSDFLRLSPSVSLPLSLRALPPGLLSPCIVLLVDILYFVPLAPLSHPFACFAVRKGGGDTSERVTVFSDSLSIKSPTFGTFSHARCLCII